MALASPLIFTSLKNLQTGKYLQTVRKRLGMGLQDVEDASALIATEEKSDQFHISVARLFQIENDSTTPSAFKILTLSAVYGLDFCDLLRRYGINPDRVHHLWSLLPHSATHLVTTQSHDSGTKIKFPVRMRANFSWERTQLIDRVVQMWGELPMTLLTKLSLREYMCGYVGLQDRTMSPLLRPGSFVMIDGKQRRIISQE
jgi:transcriptional regulator with XRE-family HTH domain